VRFPPTARPASWQKPRATLARRPPAALTPQRAHGTRLGPRRRLRPGRRAPMRSCGASLPERCRGRFWPAAAPFWPVGGLWPATAPFRHAGGLPRRASTPSAARRALPAPKPLNLTPRAPGGQPRTDGFLPPYSPRARRSHRRTPAGPGLPRRGSAAAQGSRRAALGVDVRRAGRRKRPKRAKTCPKTANTDAQRNAWAPCGPV
jgi:hypothetical protein